MKSNYWLYTILVLAIVLIGCIAVIFTGCCVKQELVCDSPYIKIGNSCCLDRDHNNICDRDQTNRELVENCLKGVDFSECSGDACFVGKSGQYCGYLLDWNCKFESFGVSCYTYTE